MIFAIIIDDEFNAREFLKKLLFRHFSEKITVVETCDSVESGVKAMAKYQADLVFLDIQMPKENGFDFFAHFNEINFEVILTTAYKEHAINAIKYNVLDYLLKPINYIDLLSTIRRLENRKKAVSINRNTETLLENFNNNTDTFNKIALPTHNGYELININNIMFCHSENNYCRVICMDEKEILLSKTLKYVQGLLNSNLFVRIHKSYLVNLNYVVSFDKTDELKITLTNGSILPVSIRKKEQFLNAILHKS